MVVTRIINWKVVDDRIILLIQLESEGQLAVEVEAELPAEIAKEIITEMPPSEAKRIHELIEQIHQIMKDRNLTYEKIDEDIEAVELENQDAIKALRGAGKTLDIKKWQGVIGALANRKQLCTERRHLIRLLINEEARLRLRLREIQTGKSV